MKISAVVAVSEHNIIGDGEKMPWHLPADLKFFKKTTMGHHIIMGRKTFDSIGIALPGRTSVILTRNENYFQSRCEIAHSIEEALTIAYNNGDEEAMFIGGGSIYQQALPYCDTVYCTEIEIKAGGKVKFPPLDGKIWKEVSREAHAADEKNPYDYAFVKYERIH